MPFFDSPLPNAQAMMMVSTVIISALIAIAALALLWWYGVGAKRVSFVVKHLFPRNATARLRRNPSSTGSTMTMSGAGSMSATKLPRQHHLRRKSSSNIATSETGGEGSSSATARSNNDSSKRTGSLKSKSRRFAKHENSGKILEKAFGLPRNLSEAMGAVADLGVRDFVSSWYYRDIAHSLEERTFVKDCRMLMLDILGHVAMRVGDLNVPLVLLDDVSPILRRYFHNYAECRRVVLENGTWDPENDPEKWEEAVIKAGFPLHAGAKEPIQHLRKLALTILKSSLCGNDRNCPTLLHLLVEIVANKVLLPTMDACHPYFLNAGFLKSGAAAAQPPLSSTVASSTSSAAPSPSSASTSSLSSSAFHQPPENDSRSSSIDISTSVATSNDPSTTSSSSSSAAEAAMKAPFTLSPLVREDYFVLPAVTTSSAVTSTGSNNNASSGTTTASNSLLEPGERITKAVVVGTELSLDDWGEKRQFDPQPHVEFVIRVTSHTVVVVAPPGSASTVPTQHPTPAKRMKKTWLIWRRFSQFDHLHRVLSSRHKVMMAKLPSKRGLARVFAGEFDRDFIEDRAANLNRYLESLINDREVAFGNHVDLEFVHFFTLGRRDVKIKMESTSKKGSNNNVSGSSSGGGGMDEKKMAVEMEEGDDMDDEEEEDEEETSIPPRRRLSLFDEGEEGTGNSQTLMRVPPDVEAHLYDLIDEIFMLDRAEFSFLRRNVVALARAIVRTSFKGRIYAWVASWGFERVEAMTRAVESAREAIWPEGHLAPPATLPSLEIQSEARKNSKRLLRSALPPAASRLVGESHLHLVGDTVHELFQCRLVVRSFVLDALDVVVRRLFPKESEEAG